jgi:uncharacterized protein (DUF1778 family)
MAKDPTTARVSIAARVTVELRVALERAAEADERTVSFLIGKILEERAIREGWIKADKPPPRRAKR